MLRLTISRGRELAARAGGKCSLITLVRRSFIAPCDRNFIPQGLNEAACTRVLSSLFLSDLTIFYEISFTLDNIILIVKNK